MMRRIIDAVAFATLLVVGVLWIAVAFGQIPTWTRSGSATGIGYPVNALPFAASATAATTSATVTVTQPSGTGQQIYVCTISFTESGGTAISAAGSLTHAVGGVTLNFAQLGQFMQTFTPCVPNDGTSMVATTPTATAATNSAVTVTGYFY